MERDQQYMTRVIDLARYGAGTVSPNPLVGCVIVHADKIIGEGWHQQYGEAHAEVNAVQNVKDKSLLQKSTVYVNLEPCAHTGKTPPCADMLVHHGVKRVVIANVDTNPLVGGKGIEKLKAAGIDVVTGVLEAEGRVLNKRFFTAMETHRPYIILKWAQTNDGFIARENYDSKWISGEQSRKLVHQWRAAEDAIMVGTNTAIYDNPRLNVRDWKGKDPVRVVIDKTLKLSTELHLLDGSQETICYSLKNRDSRKNLSYVKLEGLNFLQALLTDLYNKNIHSLIVEGGSTLLNSFIDQGLWDEARVFVAPVEFEKGIAAPKMNRNFTEEIISEDKLLIYKNE